MCVTEFPRTLFCILLYNWNSSLFCLVSVSLWIESSEEKGKEETLWKIRYELEQGFEVSASTCCSHFSLMLHSLAPSQARSPILLLLVVSFSSLFISLSRFWFVGFCFCFNSIFDIIHQKVLDFMVLFRNICYFILEYFVSVYLGINICYFILFI